MDCFKKKVNPENNRIRVYCFLKIYFRHKKLANVYASFMEESKDIGFIYEHYYIIKQRHRKSIKRMDEVKKELLDLGYKFPC